MSPRPEARSTASPGPRPATAPGVVTVSLASGPLHRAHVRVTGVAEGDLAVGGDQPGLSRRRQEVLDRPWVWLDQVHGADVAVLGDDDPVERVCGRPADALVTRRTDVALAVHTADCVPVALMSGNGVIGAAHAGWRGLLAGVLPSTVAAMRHLGGTGIRAALGPCIGVECYEFGPADRQPLVDAFGSAVAGRTADGRPAVDMREAVRASLDSVGVEVVSIDQRCTACGRVAGAPQLGSEEPTLYSHRARRDAGRQALLVWLEGALGEGLGEPASP